MEKILVVVDGQEFARRLCEFLNTRDDDVRSLTDVLEARALFKTFRPDLCLLDFDLPVCAGPKVFEEFVTIDSSVEIIFLIAQVETDIAITLMKAGVRDLLVKPVDFDHLAVAAERALQHRRLLRINREYQQHLEDLGAEKTGVLTDALSGLVGMHAGMLDTLGMALDFRDQSTSGHSRRVALWTTDIARKIGISGETLAQVERGALLHDIGKLKIPDGILCETGSLG